MKISTFPLLLALVLGGSDGHEHLDKLFQEKCNAKHAFVVGLAKREAVKRPDHGLLCTGSLVHLRFALTTVGCLHKFPTKTDGSHPNVTVMAGFDPERGTFQQRTLSRFIHYGGGAREIDTLVLIQLDRPFEASSRVSVVKLEEMGAAEECKQAETVSPIPVGGRPAIDVVCRGIELVRMSACSRLWPRLRFRLSLCGETKSGKPEGVDASICAGAEGSPLICAGALIAVQGKCEKGGAGFAQTSFVRLEPYLDFIATTVRGKPSKGEIVSIARRGGRSGDGIKEIGEDLGAKAKNKTKKIYDKLVPDFIKGKTSGSNGVNFFDEAFGKITVGICAVLYVYF